MEQPASNLFEGYRSVGHVSSKWPFIVRHGKNPQDTRIVAIVGRTFQTYTSNLTLVEVSIPHENEIKALTSDERHIYAASGRSILIWGRGSKTLILRLDNGHQADVKFLAKLNVNKLVAVDEDNTLFNWNTVTKEIINIVAFDESTFTISALCHPLNYKEKLLLGSKQGALELWNLQNEKCLFKFKGWESGVTSLAQSPVEDVVGIGLEDGHIYIHNIKYDEVVVKIYQEYGAVTSMSFRLDDQPYLVSASEVGHLMIWNLERKRLSSQIRHAHVGNISNCQFLRNESLLVTSGDDNSIKMWSMDMTDGGGSLLCQRSGHSEPPTFIRFYGSKGFNLLSAGGDSTLKMFHMFSERLNRNLGTARLNPKSNQKASLESRKLPPITRFAVESTREKQWDSIAACHQDSSLVTTWNYDKCRMGEHLISQPTFRKHGITATSICITGCGNFVTIGFSKGFIFRYNIQSGIFRLSYEDTGLAERRAHDSSVTGLQVDSLDVILVSTGADHKLKLWNFKTAALLSCIDFPSSIELLELHRDNNIVAISLSNNDIELMDLETRTLIRHFSNQSKVLDMTFSPDSRWLIASLEDCSIRTWDLSLGKLIDCFRLSSPCVSLSISSTGEFLATALKGDVGISIWCNHTIYSPTILKVVDEQMAPPLLDMPHVRCDEPSNEDEESDDQALPELDQMTESCYRSPDQLHEDLITLSGLPSSRWKNLLKLEEIREKQQIQEEQNRVKEVKVPFFIPVKDGLKPQLDREALQAFNQDNSDSEQSAALRSRVVGLCLLSPIAQCLLECGSKGDFSDFFEKFKLFGPSAIDAEIRSLGSDICGQNQPMIYFLHAMEQGLKSNADYELIISWLALFLKTHADLIQADKAVKQCCRTISDTVNKSWSRLHTEFNQVFCVLNFVRSAIL